MSSPLKKDSTLQVTEQEGVVLSNVRRGGGFEQVSLYIAGHREGGLNLLDKNDRFRPLYIAGNTEEQRRIGRLHSSGLAGSRVGAHCYGSIQVAILRYNCN